MLRSKNKKRRYPEVSCADFKRVLKLLGFEQEARKATSHEQWSRLVNGSKRKVTVDCPKAPFRSPLLDIMVKSQMGITKDEFFDALENKVIPADFKAKQ